MKKRQLRRRRIETAVAALLAATTVVIAATRSSNEHLGPKHLALERMGGFREPTFLAQPPGENNLLFVAERHGTIRIIADGEKVHTPFLDIRGRVKAKGAEQGLFSMAFAPDYESSGEFYVAFTAISGDLKVTEFKRSDDTELLADRDSAREVLRVRENSAKHHGGQLMFGPDRHLYIGSGDGGPSYDPYNAAQARGKLLGKILRIDPARKGRKPYTVPADNPFVGRHGRDEIYAYGLRNPWRFSFDRATGMLAVGDVGQDKFEEVDLLPAGKAKGANFGWSAYEGFGRFKGGIPRRATVKPTLAYPHGPGCSVTGGYVVRDPQLARLRGREVVGRYLFGDYCTGKIYSLLPPAGKPSAGRDHPIGLRVPLLTSFGEDRSGQIYLLSGKGPVYRLIATRHR